MLLALREVCKLRFFFWDTSSLLSESRSLTTLARILGNRKECCPMGKLETATVIWQSVWVFSSSILLSVSLLFLFFSIFSLGTDCALSFSKGPWILLFFPSLSLFLLFSYGNFHWCFFSSQILSFLTCSICLSDHLWNSLLQWSLIQTPKLSSTIHVFCVYWLFLHVLLVYILRMSWLFYMPILITKPLHCAYYVSSGSVFRSDVILL